MSTNPRVALYREAISLEEKRAGLQTEIDRLTARLSAIQNELVASENAFAAAPAPVTPRRVGRARRGELKTHILEGLAAAGTAGVRVKDLAVTLGVKTANLHSWFQTSAKRIPQIKRVGSGRYRLEGNLEAAAHPTARGSLRGRRSTRPLSKRGELSARILEVLKAAGSGGIKVRLLAEKLGVKYKNLFIWFATTGKKNKAIKKVGEAHYRLES
jgi:hypothetical protein